MSKTVKRFLGLGSVLIGLGAPLAVLAHTPYLAPASYEPSRGDVVTLDASFAEKFFVPEIAIDKVAFYVINPDGRQTDIDTKHSLVSRVVLEHKLEQEGTYRFSTGERTGRIFRVYELDGERKALMNAEEALPDGAKMLEHFQSITKAETYVSKGSPNALALQKSGQGLELQAKNHPNELFVGDEFKLTVLFDGKPLDKAKVDVYVAQYQFGAGKALQTLLSKKGLVRFTPQQQGVYLLRVRHRVPAPKTAAAPLYSYTYSVVFEVLE